MGVIIGPTPWWQANIVRSCPVGTTLPDGSRVICKAGGTAWIVAPACTQVGSNWGNTTCCGSIDTPPVGISTHPQITTTNFPVLFNQLVSCGFNPSDWFVPCRELLQNPGYACRTQWDSFSLLYYWSSTESIASGACLVSFNIGITYSSGKSNAFCVRAFRCVTY